MNKWKGYPFKESVRDHNFRLEELESEFKGYAIETCALYRNGEIIYSYEAEGGLSTQKHKLNSVTKSILSIITGIAIDQGYISHTELSIASVFKRKTVNDTLKEIQLYDLLTMTSGLSSASWRHISGTDNWTDAILQTEVPSNSEKKMIYNNADSHLISAVIQEATGVTAEEFADKYLFSPLGISDYSWDQSPEGISVGGYGIHLPPADLLKLSAEILTESSSVVPRNWLASALKPVVPSERWKQHYGLHWWVSEKIDRRQPEFCYAAGRGGKFIFLCPESDAAVIFTADLSAKDSLLPYQWFVKYIARELM